MTTNLVQDTVNYIQTFCRYQPASIGMNNMPIIGIVNIVQNIIKAAPMQWRFNRNQVQLTGPVVANQQDYSQTISDLGYLEKAVINDGTKIWEMEHVKNNEPLAPSNTIARPNSIAVQSSDGSGNYVFRLSAVPDQAYTITLVYQKAPVKFTALSDPWSPIPDAFSDIYNNLCLGYYMDSCQDSRAQQYIARGIAGLLARQSGLSLMDKALFAQAYMNLSAAELYSQLKLQQATQARGSAG
jgi:hypothetical protein